MSDTKKCAKCGRTMPLSEFHRDRRRKDGRTSHCKECVYRYQAAYRKERRSRRVQEFVKSFAERKKLQHVRNVTRTGLLPRDECAVIGCHLPGHYHHLDYRHPERLIPLCDKHHHETHGALELLKAIARDLGIDADKYLSADCLVPLSPAACKPDPLYPSLDLDDEWSIPRLEVFPEDYALEHEWEMAKQEVRRRRERAAADSSPALVLAQIHGPPAPSPT